MLMSCPTWLAAAVIWHPGSWLWPASADRLRKGLMVISRQPGALSGDCLWSMYSFLLRVLTTCARRCSSHLCSCSAASIFSGVSHLANSPLQGGGGGAAQDSRVNNHIIMHAPLHTTGEAVSNQTAILCSHLSYGTRCIQILLFRSLYDTAHTHLRTCDGRKPSHQRTTQQVLYSRP